MLGLEVELVHQLAPTFEKVVVARVVSVEPHPQADRLRIAQVFDGQTTHQVVCGASNCRAGIKTAFAPIGARLSLDAEPFEIKKAKLRAIESFGMLCSQRELGIGNEDEGIMEFASQLLEGADVAELYADIHFDLSLTPNLSHCNSIYGVARELALVAGTFKPLQLEVAHQKPLPEEPPPYRVKIASPELCREYYCRLVEGVKVAPSPAWLQRRLEAVGVRPINNVVDVTNYVMVELGQPLHAFDADKLEGDTLLVRAGVAGESLLTLSDREVMLQGGEAVIADGRGAIALGGLIGAERSKVDDSTQRLLLESALFEPNAIRRASRQLSLITDASQRFERGVDPEMVSLALERACELLLQIGAASHLAPARGHGRGEERAKGAIRCRLRRLQKLLGMAVGAGEVEQLFERLAMSYSWDEVDEAYLVYPPSHRRDLVNEIDLIEEVARLYGYEQLPRHQSSYRPSTIVEDPLFVFSQKVRKSLLQQGLQEVLTCDLIGYQQLEKSGGTSLEPDQLISLANPSSADYSLLRPSLLPGLLKVIHHNINHGTSSLAGFEIGRIHYKEKGRYLDQEMVAFFLMGHEQPFHWDRPERKNDFFDLKGIVENLFDLLAISDTRWEAGHLSILHPGQQALLFSPRGEEIGAIGYLHPFLARRWEIPQPVFFGQLHLAALAELSLTTKRVEPLPLYPASARDWTVTLPETTSLQQLLDAIWAHRPQLLESCEQIALYRGAGVPSHQKKVTLRFVYRNLHATLSQREVEQQHGDLLAHLCTTMRITP